MLHRYALRHTGSWDAVRERHRRLRERHCVLTSDGVMRVQRVHVIECDDSRVGTPAIAES